MDCFGSEVSVRMGVQETNTLAFCLSTFTVLSIGGTSQSFTRAGMLAYH